MSDHHHIDSTTTGLHQFNEIFCSDKPVSISSDAFGRIRKCREYLDTKLDHSDALFYGINTGFGFLQNVQIDKAQLQELQSNLIKSHACGMGEEVPASIVKLMMAL
ncbi:MAG TPA: aromatic amino acid lyase, partial [Ferruginibacter sp.]|nr:aromatic amino acid lyase [Ferruginibacter sp.]